MCIKLADWNGHRKKFTIIQNKKYFIWYIKTFITHRLDHYFHWLRTRIRDGHNTTLLREGTKNYVLKRLRWK